MKQIRSLILFVVVLTLTMCVSNTYAIKFGGGKKNPRPKKRITTSHILHKREISKRQTHVRVPRAVLESKVERTGLSKARVAPRPMQHLSWISLDKRIPYGKFSPTFKTPKKIDEAVVEQAQEEVLARTQEFVTKNDRWMEIESTTREDAELAVLTTRIMLYGDKKYPAVTQLIELYESRIPADQKGLVATAREVVQFLQREDNWIKESTDYFTLDTEAKDLLRQLTDFNLPFNKGSDPILVKCGKLVQAMQLRNLHRNLLMHFEDFVAQERRLPQTYGWNGKEQTQSKYSQSQRNEYYLRKSVERMMDEFPDGTNVFADKIRVLWKEGETFQEE